MKKLKTMLAMMLALVSMTVAFTSCSSDDDEDDAAVAVAEQVVGTYTGDLTIKVSTSEDTTEGLNFKVEKVDDSHVNVTLPSYGEGAMSFPGLTVKNLLVTGSNGTYTIPETTFDQTIQVNGVDKVISQSAISATFTSGKMTLKYAMQYGKMPMVMNCSTVATKK